MRRLSSFKEWFMTGEVKAHETTISMVKAAPAELDAGADIELKVKVSCPSACDLQCKIIKIIAQYAVVLNENELVTFDDTAIGTNVFRI